MPPQLWTLAIATVTAVLAFGGGDLGRSTVPAAAAPTAATTAPVTYLAVGDSLAYGMQVGKLKAEIAAGTVSAGSFDTGYVDVFAAHLRTHSPAVNVVNLGCPGESTASFIAGPCGYATTGKPFGTAPLPLHTAYQGSQLDAALDYLHEHPGQVQTITLDIGINDLRAAAAGCPTGDGFSDCLAAHWAPAVQKTAANLDTIVGRIRAAAPAAEFLVLDYYNWMAVDDPATDKQVEKLNAAIADAATRHGARVVHVYPAFNRTGDESRTLCELTLYCGPSKDLHPSDAGYSTIGRLLFETAGPQVGRMPSGGAATGGGGTAGVEDQALIMLGGVSIAAGAGILLFLRRRGAHPTVEGAD